VGSVLGQIGGLAKDIRAAITGKEILDPTKLAELESKALEIEAAASSAQTDINKIEAANPSIFVSGWRPFVGWVCGLSFAWVGFIGPFAEWTLTLFKIQTVLPRVDTTVMMEVLFALLGFAGMRTYEKFKGTART
jgi:hypothetical protein